MIVASQQEKLPGFLRIYMLNLGVSISYFNSSTSCYHDNNPVAKKDEI